MKLAPIAAIGLPLGLLVVLAGCAAAVLEGPAVTFRNPAAVEATTWLPEDQPDRRIRYAGDSPVQYGDLRLPTGRVPTAGHPVAVVIHGGAWHADWTSESTPAPLPRPSRTLASPRGISSSAGSATAAAGIPAPSPMLGWPRTSCARSPRAIRSISAGWSWSATRRAATWRFGSPAVGTCPRAVLRAGPIRSRSPASYRLPASSISKARWRSAIAPTCSISSEREQRRPARAWPPPRRGGSFRSACRRC